MKISLINSYIDVYRSEPHGILMIAAVLEREGHIIQLMDGLFEEIDYKKIESFRPDLIGISVMTLTYHKVKEIINHIKKILPQTKIVLGGVHPSSCPEESLVDLKVDFVVIGEGEETIVELCNTLEKKGECDFNIIRGLAFLQEGRFIKNSPRKLISDLNSLPYPARHLLNMEKYFVPPGFIRGLFFDRIATIMTSRGCPFECIFCSQKYIFGRTYRRRSVPNVIEEIIVLKSSYGIEGIHFMDENFIVNKQWIKEFCAEVGKLNICWSCEARANSVDPGILKLMEDSGCLQVDLGIESGSNRVLKSLKKRLTIEEIQEGCQLIKNAGIRIFVNVLIGSPQETKKELYATYDLLRKIKPDFGVANFLTAIPGTELYSKYIKEGGVSYYKREGKDLSYNYYPITNLSSESDDTLVSYHKKFRNYFILKNCLSLMRFNRLNILIKIILYFCSNIIFLYKTLYKVIFKGGERKIYKIIFDTIYIMQKHCYEKKIHINTRSI